MNHHCDYQRPNVTPWWSHCASCGNDRASHVASHFGGGCRPERIGVADSWGFPAMETCRCRGWRG